MWELWLEDGECEPVHRVTLLVLERPAPADRVFGKREGLARCLVLESLAPDVWPPGDVGDWGLTDFADPMARRLG